MLKTTEEIIEAVKRFYADVEKTNVSELDYGLVINLNTADVSIIGNNEYMNPAEKDNYMYASISKAMCREKMEEIFDSRYEEADLLLEWDEYWDILGGFDAEIEDSCYIYDLEDRVDYEINDILERELIKKLSNQCDKLTDLLNVNSVDCFSIEDYKSEIEKLEVQVFEQDESLFDKYYDYVLENFGQEDANLLYDNKQSHFTKNANISV